VGTSPTVGMSVEEAARALRCSPNTIRRYIQRGRVRAERLARPQGYAWRVYLEAPPTMGDTSQPETSHAVTSQVPPEVPPTWLVPLAQELAAARTMIAHQAEQIGRLTAELEQARAAEVGEAPTKERATPAPRPWWAFWRR
jgi:excisionase family DNA binding protein